MDKDGSAPSPRDPRAWWTLAVAVVKDAKEDRALGLGAEVAFFILLSMPPTLLAVFGSVGFIAERLGERATGRIRDEIVGVVSPFLTPDAIDGLQDVLDTFLAEGRAGVAIFGLALALWSASRATNVFIEAVNIAYDLPDSRTGVRRRLTAFGITLLGILGAITLLPLLVLGPRLGQWIGGPLGMGELFAQLWRVLYWPGVALLGIALLASFYHWAPSWETPWRRDLPGAVLAAVLWLAGGAGLRLYIAISIQGNDAYSGLGTPIAVLLWVYVTALALLVGAELNAEIEKLWPSELTRAKLTGEIDDRDEHPEPPEEATGPEGVGDRSIGPAMDRIAEERAPGGDR